MKCPRCSGPIGPDDAACPSCGSILVVERRPTRPEEEKGWALRHLASIMGRVGCVLMIAQCVIVLIGSAALFGQAAAFLGGQDRNVEFAPVEPLILIAGTVDLVGLGLLAVALIVLGTGAVFLRRRDPFTEEEVMIPPTTAAFPMASGLFVILWLFLTAVWRLIYPAEVGASAAGILALFAATGPAGAPAILPTMMGLWVVAAIALLAASVALQLFVRRLPSKTFSPRPMKPSSWLDFTIFNFLITLGVAAFPLGWVGYDTTGGPAQIAFLTFLATKITVIPLLGAFAYWSLFTRLDALGKLSLLVPVLKATPPAGPIEPAAGPGATALGRSGASRSAFPPPSDDEMAGIDRVR